MLGIADKCSNYIISYLNILFSLIFVDVDFFVGKNFAIDMVRIVSYMLTIPQLLWIVFYFAPLLAVL